MAKKQSFRRTSVPGSSPASQTSGTPPTTAAESNKPMHLESGGSATKTKRPGSFRRSNQLKTYEVIPDKEMAKYLRPRDNQMSDKNLDKMLPVNSGHYLWVLLAPPGSGKSTLMLNALLGPYQGNFTDVYFMSPTAEKDPKWKTVVKGLKALGTFYNVCTVSNIQNIIKDMDTNVAEWEKDHKLWEGEKKNPYHLGPHRPEPVEPNHLAILDDCADKFGSHQVTTHPLTMISNNRRHLKCSNWIVAHRINFLLPGQKTGADMMTIYKTPNQPESKLIEESLQCPRATLRSCLNQTTNRPFGFLHIHWLKNRLPTFFDSQGSRLKVDYADTVLNDSIIDMDGAEEVIAKLNSEAEQKASEKPEKVKKRGKEKIKMKDPIPDPLKSERIPYVSALGRALAFSAVNV